MAELRLCCGLPMDTLELFGIRMYRCSHRPHHPVTFVNLSTGEELAEAYHDGDDGVRWTSHWRDLEWGEVEQ